MLLHEILHYLSSLAQVVLFWLNKGFGPFLILFSCSLFDLIANRILLKIWRLKFFDLDFRIVIQFGFESFRTFGLSNAHIIVVPPVLQHHQFIIIKILGILEFSHKP